MAKYLRLPDGSLYEVPDNMSYGEAMQLARKDYPDAFGAAQPQAQAPAEQPQAERTWGEAITDTGAGLVKGVGNLVQLPGQLYGLATGDFSDTGVLAAGKRIREAGEGMESDVLKQRRAAVQQKVQAAESQGAIEAFKTSFMETVKDPALISSFIAEQLPQLVPIIATGGTAAGLAAGRASAAALAKGATADVAAKAAQAAAVKIGTTAAIQTGAVMQGTDVGADTYDAIYKNVLQHTKDPQKAAEAALNRARAAGVAGYGISVLANRYLLGGEALEKALLGGKTGVGMVTGAATGALKEIPSENVEELGGALARNIALKDVDPTQSLTQGLGETAAQATLGAVALGGVAGANAGRGGAEIARAKRQEERAAQERTAAEEAKAKAEQMADPQYLLDIGQRYDALIEQRKQLREIINRKVEKDDLEGQQTKQDARRQMQELDQDTTNRDLVREYRAAKPRIEELRRAPEDVMLGYVGMGAEPTEGIQARGKAKGLYAGQPSEEAQTQQPDPSVQWARGVVEWATDPSEVRIRPLEQRSGQSATGGLDDLAALLMERPERAAAVAKTRPNIPGLSAWQNTQLYKRLNVLVPAYELRRQATEAGQRGTQAAQSRLLEVEAEETAALDSARAEEARLRAEYEEAVRRAPQDIETRNARLRLEAAAAEVAAIERMAQGASDFTGQGRLFADEAQGGASAARTPTARRLAQQLQIARATGNRREAQRLVEALRDQRDREASVTEREGPAVPAELQKELGAGEVPPAARLRETRDEAFAGYVDLISRFNRGAARQEQLESQQQIVINSLIREAEENRGSPLSQSEADIVARDAERMLRDLRMRFGDTRGTVQVGPPKDADYTTPWNEDGTLRTDITEPGATGYGAPNVESFGPGYRTFGSPAAAVRSIEEGLDRLARTTAQVPSRDHTDLLGTAAQRFERALTFAQQRGGTEADQALVARLADNADRVLRDTETAPLATEYLDDVRAGRLGSAESKRQELAQRLDLMDRMRDNADTRALPFTGRRGAPEPSVPYQTSTEFASFEELDRYLASDALKEQRAALGLTKDTVSRLNKRLEPLRQKVAELEQAAAEQKRLYDVANSASEADHAAAKTLVKETQRKVDRIESELDAASFSLRQQLAEASARLQSLHDRRAFVAREIQGIYSIWANASQTEQSVRATIAAQNTRAKQLLGTVDAPASMDVERIFAEEERVRQLRRATGGRMSLYVRALDDVAKAFAAMNNIAAQEGAPGEFSAALDLYLQKHEEAAIQLAELRKEGNALTAAQRNAARAEKQIADLYDKSTHAQKGVTEAQQAEAEAREKLKTVRERHEHLISFWEKEQALVKEQKQLARQIAAAKGTITKTSKRMDAVRDLFLEQQGQILTEYRAQVVQAEALRDEVLRETEAQLASVRKDINAALAEAAPLRRRLNRLEERVRPQPKPAQIDRGEKPQVQSDAEAAQRAAQTQAEAERLVAPRGVGRTQVSFEPRRLLASKDEKAPRRIEELIKILESPRTAPVELAPVDTQERDKLRKQQADLFNKYQNAKSARSRALFGDMYDRITARLRDAEQTTASALNNEELVRVYESMLPSIEVREAARVELEKRRADVDEKLSARLRSAEMRSSKRNDILKQLKDLEPRIEAKALNMRDLAAIERRPERRAEIEAKKAPLLQQLQDRRARLLEELKGLDERISKAFGVSRTPLEYRPTVEPAPAPKTDEEYSQAIETRRKLYAEVDALNEQMRNAPYAEYKKLVKKRDALLQVLGDTSRDDSVAKAVQKAVAEVRGLGLKKLSEKRSAVLERLSTSPILAELDADQLQSVAELAIGQPSGRAAGPVARNIGTNQQVLSQAREATATDEAAADVDADRLVAEQRLEKHRANLVRIQNEIKRLKDAGRLKKGRAYTERGRTVVDLERRVKGAIERITKKLESYKYDDTAAFEAAEDFESQTKLAEDLGVAQNIAESIDVELPSEMRENGVSLEFSDPIEPLTMDAYEAALDGRVLDVLDVLADIGSNALIRDSAAALRPLVMRTKIEVTTEPVTLNGQRVEAKYSPAQNKATFDIRYLGERTVVHELSHAATMRALDTPVEQQTPAQRRAVQELDALLADVKKDPKLEGAAFTENLPEFVADLFSNTRLHAALDRGMKNWFKRFYNGIANLIGLPKLQLTSERALAQAKELLMPSRQIKAVNQTDVASVMRGVFPNADIKTAAGTPNAISKGVSQIVGRGEQSWWQKVQANVAGLAFRTQFLDNYAPIEQLTRMGVERGKLDSMRAFQTMYYLRFGQQRNQFLAQAASRGVPQLVKNPDGGFTYEAKEGPNLAEISRILSDADIGDAQQVEGEFTAFLAIRRAMQVPGGFEKLNTKEPMTRAQAEAFMADVAADPKRQQAFERAAEVYRQYNANLLDFLVQTGAMEKVKADALKRGDFVPFYRSTPDGTVELVVMGERPVRIGDIASQPYLKEMLGDDQKILPVFTSALQNTAMLLDMGLRNQAVKDTAYTMRDLGMGKVGSGVGPTGARSKRNTLHFKEKGADRFLIMDEAALDQYGVPAELLVKGMEGIKTTLPWVVKAMGVPANWLRAGVTRMPTYALRQLIRDPINAWLVTGGNFTPVLSSLGELAKMQGGRSPTEDVLQRAGAISSNVFTGDKADWNRTLRDISAGKNTWDTALAKLDAFATQGDTATRAVLYNMYRERGMTHMEALLGSLESMNFSRRGVSPTMHFLSTMIPFFNAQIQGLDVIYRAAKGVSLFEKETNARGKMLARGALMLGSTLLYAAMMQDDEAYKNATEQERALNWFVRFPGLDEPVRVPIPFELGYAFKAIPEMLINAAAEDKEAGDVVAGIGKLLYNSIPLGIPQALKPGIEVVTNYSFYSGRDIVSAREQALEPEAQVRQNTTALAQMLGGAAGVSPIQIDYLIRGYFGGLGALVAQMPNIVFRPGAPDEQVERAERKLSELPVVGSLFQPTDGRGLIDEAYKTSQDFDRKARTYKALVEQGRRAEAQAFAQRYIGEIAAASEAGRFRQQMGEFAKYRRFIQASPSLSAQEKREQLDALRKIEIAYAQQLQALGKTTRQ